MENNTYVEEYGKRFNDEGEEVPEVCDKCGSNIGVYLKGEPVYLCSDCKKYFGTVPCNVKESFIMGEDFSYCFDGERHDLKKLEKLIYEFVTLSECDKRNSIQTIVEMCKVCKYDWKSLFGLGKLDLEYISYDYTPFTKYLDCLDQTDVDEYNAYVEYTCDILRDKEIDIEKNRLTILEYFTYLNDLFGYESSELINESTTDHMIKVTNPPKILYFGYHEDVTTVKDNDVGYIVIPSDGLRLSPYKGIAALFGIDPLKILSKKYKPSEKVIHYAYSKYIPEDGSYDDKINVLRYLPSYDNPPNAFVKSNKLEKHSVLFKNPDAHIYPIRTDQKQLKDLIYFDKLSDLKTYYIPGDITSVEYMNYDYTTSFHASLVVTYLNKNTKNVFNETCSPNDNTSGTCYSDDSYNKTDNYYTESELQPAIRESLELIKSSVTSKYFPDEFADYSSSMYFREELKNFIKHATVVVQSKNGPMPEGLHHLWMLAKAAVDYDEYKKYMDQHEESLRLAESRVKRCERAINEYDSSNNKGQKNIDSLKIDLDQAIRYREYVMRDTNWSYHKSLVIRSISRILSYGYVKESFEDVFGPVIQETYQPYDEYLKLHQYDPKTNTIVINGKRMNAGIVGSNKQRNRMNKFLRENNYNPKDGTIETSIDENGTKKRVEFNIDPHDTGSMNQYVLVDRTTGKAIKKDFDISMSPKSMSNKPGISNQTKEHETGHGDMYLNPEKYKQQLQDSNTHNQAKKAAGNYRGGNPAQVRHAMNPEENVADLYAAKNNKYGQSWGNSNYGRMIENERRNRIQTERQDVKKDIAYNQKKYQYYVDKENKNGTLSEDEEDLKNYYKRMANAVPDRKTIVNNATNGTEMRSFRNEMNSRKEFVDKNLNQNNQGNNQNQSQNTPSPPPIKESFEEMFGPVIQEAFDAITGEEIPINHAYTMEEMAKRSLSLDEAKAIEKDGLIPIKPPKTDEVYFGSPTNHMPEIDLNRPLFVSPYKGIASIFIWGDMGLQDRIPRGSYNHNYEEWINFDEKKMENPLKEVHVYVEGAPFLEPFTVEQEGYIHCISTKYYLNNFFRKPWMSKDLEYLIAKTDNMKVEFTRSIKCKVKYYIKGRPSPKGKSYGPSKSGVLQYIHKIAKSIHAKYKADQKEPTGNQNCLLCAWCAEASIRGGEYLPRPVYSPRDPALEIVPGDIVGGVAKNNPGNFHDMLAHLRKDSIGQPFARWYCHAKWSQSNGGHEFLIVKIDENAFNIMDPQQGIVRPLTADDSYMKDVDWEGTYICRIDDKPFKYMKLDQINDPKKTLPWDPKKDIPYMVKHGMCTKEEAENELKNAETNLFTSELKKSLKQTHIQESASDPMTIIPKDLRDWLKKGDYSSLEKDDSYYYVEGYPVEEFWRDPEFVRSAFYLDDKNDPSYNSIVFSDDNGNGLIYDPTDGWYYYLYHDWTEDDTGFLHRERLSSKSWTQIIDPTHSKIIRDLDEKRSKISKELTHLKGNPIYDDIEYGATNSHFGKGFFKSDCSAMEKRWNAIGHEWCNAVEDFADKHKFSELSEAVDTFANKTMSLFVPTFGSHEYDIEAYKEGAKNVIKAFQDVEKSLKESLIQEGAWNDIRNGVNPWSDKLIFHISPEGYLDGQVFKPRVPAYLDKYDPTQPNFEDVDNPRVCFSTSIEGALNAILVNIGRWKTAEKLNNWYVYIPEKPLKEYKHSTNKNIIRDKKVFDANLTKEIWIEEPVRLKQYGIIRIDQVKSVARRKTVPTINGEKGDRNYYSFKWHWLVRPNVLKDIPYDYSPIAVCNNMLDDISKFKYGLGYGGSIHHGSSKDFDEKYRFESPEEFEKNGGGICYDFVEWQEGYLEAYGYTCRKFYISTDTRDGDTHTFILVDDGKGEFIYPEAAFELMRGVYKVKSPEDAVLKVMDRIFDINDNDKKYDEIKYYVWEYEGHPPYGSTMKEATEYFSKGEPFHEGTATKIKRKD